MLLDNYFQIIIIYKTLLIILSETTVERLTLKTSITCRYFKNAYWVLYYYLYNVEIIATNVLRIHYFFRFFSVTPLSLLSNIIVRANWSTCKMEYKRKIIIIRKWACENPTFENYSFSWTILLSQCKCMLKIKEQSNVVK